MKTDIEKTLTLYKKIDETISTHFSTHKKQPPCKKGCSSCCSQFFEISEVEYAIIDDGLHSLSPEAQSRIKMKSQVLVDLFADTWSTFYDDYFSDSTNQLHDEAYYQRPERFEVNMPCVFLSDDGACEIYETRPMVCRTTGGGFLHIFNKDAICSLMPVSLFTPLWQADLRPFKEEIAAIRWLQDDSNMSIKRQYPMFYYVYKSFS